MAESREQESKLLLRRAADGDQLATERLLGLHRQRLRAMIALRLDRRMSARIDPSDVLQETMIQAHKKLPEYLRTQPIPFYPWIRRIAWEKIVQLHRQHLGAQSRAVTREERFFVGLPDESRVALVDRLVAKGSSANQQLIQKELKARVHSVLADLDPRDHEILVLRFLEQLSVEEASAVLEISEEAVKSRQRRALERFSFLIEGTSAGELS